MAKAPADTLEPDIGFHPYRAIFELPFPVYPDGCWTEDRHGVDTGHPGLDALMALEGIAIVSLRGNRVTLIRDPGTAWESILPRAQEVLRIAFLADEVAFAPPA